MPLWLFPLFCVLLVCAPARAGARIVHDQLDRRVEIAQNPQRIVSLAPSITECLFAIGQGKRVVGATSYSNYPPEAKDLPRVGSYIHLDLEKIVGLNPDLCPATKDGNPLETIKRLEQLHIPVYALDPRNFQAVMDTISELGGLLRAKDRAGKVVRDMTKRLKRVRDGLPPDWVRPRVFFQIGISPIVSVGTQTFVHELIRLAGGVNLAAGPKPYPHYSREEILMLDPDIILINSMTGNRKLAEQAEEKWKRFPQLSAVQNDAIYAVNSDIFNRPTPRLVKALEILANIFKKCSDHRFK